jgi:hypothetical protein
MESGGLVFFPALAAAGGDQRFRPRRPLRQEAPRPVGKCVRKLVGAATNGSQITLPEGSYMAATSSPRRASRAASNA